MNKYDIEEIKEKLDRCKNMKLEDVTLDDVDEIGSIKIDCLTRVLENLYR